LQLLGRWIEVNQQIILKLTGTFHSAAGTDITRKKDHLFIKELRQKFKYALACPKQIIHKSIMNRKTY
jgi:hypothetical protein